VPAASLAVCPRILFLLLSTSLARRLANDASNHRSLHTRPTPRVSGMGQRPGRHHRDAVPDAPDLLATLVAAALAAVSQIDARRGLPACVRFGTHVAAVAVLIAANPAPAPW